MSRLLRRRVPNVITQRSQARYAPASQCKERGQIEALLRREGIYSSHLAQWRKALNAHGLGGMGRPGRKTKRDAKDRRIQELEHQLATANKDLLVANGLLALQKKLSELLDVALPTSQRS